MSEPAAPEQQPQEQPAEAAKPQVRPPSNKPLKPDAEARGKIYNNILETIGGTPLVRLPNFTKKYDLQADLMLKMEFFNPLASVKDRIGFAMIEAAERAGTIKPGVTTLIEPTSGNTGIALAFVAAAKGYKLILTMPESMSLERRRMLSFYGAELVLTPTETGMKGAIERAQQLHAEDPNSLILGQFENPANPQIHSETTAEEIWADTEGKVDILVSGVGTGGTITGTSRVIKARKPEFKAFAVEPEESPVISGGEAGPHKIQGIGAGFIPENLDTKLIDGIVKVDSQTALDTARELAKVEGVPGGISTGANLAAAKQIAQMPENKGKMIVAIGCSFAERYISSVLFEGLGGE